MNHLNFPECNKQCVHLQTSPFTVHCPGASSFRFGKRKWYWNPCRWTLNSGNSWPSQDVFFGRRSWQGLNPVDEMPRLKFPHRWARIHVITLFWDWNLRVLRGDLPTKNKLPSCMSNFNYLRVSLMILRREIIHALCNFWVSFLLGFIIRQVSSSRGKFRYLTSSGAQDILMKTILGSC